MGARRKKKGDSGEVKMYITRNAAIKKLQVSLLDFRKLCILKGIYPREPKHRQKVQGGDTKIKTVYYMKDIQFLLNEPIIWKFREHRACMKKVKRAYNRKEPEKGGGLFSKRPHYSLGHVVRERYPTFADALRDLDDPLTLSSLFAKMAAIKKLKTGLLESCRRLTTEFMMYVIETKALRKVFISIKGYYYQVEVMGQTITWVSPHAFAPRGEKGVDFRIMKTFLEFYLTLLGFVNFRLFTSLDLYYPPKMPGSNRIAWSKQQRDTENNKDIIDEMSSERLVSLNVALQRKKVTDDEDEEGIDMHLLEQEGVMLQDVREEEERKKKQQELFKGFKFFLNRETNLESLTFIIRACSGEVSWDKLRNAGSTFQESDETITHQIVDRPQVDQKYLSRYYVQPQWVYDCINARLLLPVQDYFPEAELPPHLSPFNVETEQYVPPEQKQLMARQRGEIPEEQLQNPESEDSGTDSEDNKEPQIKRSARQKAQDKAKRRRLRDITKKKQEAAAARAEKERAETGEAKVVDKNNENGETEEASSEGKMEASKTEAATEDNMTAQEEGQEKEGTGNGEEREGTGDSEEKEGTGNSEEKEERGSGKKKRKMEKEVVEMEVSKGKKYKVKSRVRQQEKREEFRLNVMMIPKKNKRVYHALKRKEDRIQQKVDFLTWKRATIDHKTKQDKKALKKQAREKSS